MTPFDADDARLSGATLVEASAGTGKTHTIGTLYLRLVVESALPVHKILVVTFTNAATAELRDRLRRRLSDALARIERAEGGADAFDGVPFLARAWATDRIRTRNRLVGALHGFDEAAVFTIHGFCHRILREYAFESGTAFDAELVSEQGDILDDAVRDYWVARMHDADPGFIEHCAESRFGIDRLRQLVDLALGHAQLRVVPEELPQPESFAKLSAREAVARAAVVASWQSDREAIVAALTQTEVLNRAKYKLATIHDKWLPEIDAALAIDAQGVFGRCAYLTKLTTAKLLEGTKKGQTPPQHAFFAACDELEAAEAALRQNFDLALQELQRDALVRLPEEIAARKRSANVLSFDDLLRQLAAALRSAHGEELVQAVRRKFSAALIDEFQDTDPLQYEIFQRLFVAPATPVVFVGDPKQAIYAFRGADIHAYLRARRTEGMHAYTLAVNWRSDPCLLTALNTFFESHADPFDFAEIAYHPVAPKPGATDRLRPADAPALQFLVVPRDFVPEVKEDPKPRPIAKDAAANAAARGVAFEVANLLGSSATIIDGAEERPVQPRDIAVLCRTNRQIALVQHRLRALGIPSVSQSAQSVFDTESAEAVERIVRGLLAPRDTRIVKAALATPILGVDAAGLDAMRSDETAWDVWGSRFVDWHERWSQRGFLSAFQALLDGAEVLPRLLALPDGERRATDTLHLVELLHQQEARERLRPHGLLRWLQRLRTDSALRNRLVGEDQHIRLESDADAVGLTTIHKSKGLEYPIVFCPFLWDERRLQADELATPTCHDEETHGRVLALGADEEACQGIIERMESDRRAEALRLLYVALTRARHRCYVVWGPFSSAKESALGRFLGDPGNGVERAAAEHEATAQAAPEVAGPVVAGIEKLAAASGATIGWRKIARLRSAKDAKEADTVMELQPPQRQRTRRPASVVSSFTGLIARHELGTAEDASDRDGIDHGARAATISTAAGDSPSVRLGAFPAGRHAGNFLHEVLERIDFRAVEDGPAAIEDEVRDGLVQHGFAPQWTADICHALVDVLRTTLQGAGASLRLADIGRGDRLPEFDFMIPAGRATEPLAQRAEALAAAFAAHGEGARLRAWARRLAQRQIAPPHGHLKGFVDLVFRHDGRWYLADYKSNWLGPRAADFRAERLAEAMADHDYYLQYHLYTVGLLRYLRRRLPDFDHERHFGGAFYFFLRGMAPQHPRGTGVFFDRPSAALVHALDAVLVGDG